MTTFDDRERAFESKFAHDQEMQFKAEARRNKLLGLWAAERMGLSGDEADAYAKSVIIADFEEAGDEDVYRKVAGDVGLEALGAQIGLWGTGVGGLLAVVGGVIFVVVAIRTILRRASE